MAFDLGFIGENQRASAAIMLFALCQT